MNITGPGQRPVPLPNSPNTTDQINYIGLHPSGQPLIQLLAIFCRIGISDLLDSAKLVAKMVKMILGIFRFGFVQPEYSNTFVVIILFDNFPYKLTGGRICGIKES